MGELRVAVRVIATLSRLAVGLATVVQLAQQICHHPLAGPEPLGSQCLDDVALAAAHPTQRRTGIAADRIVDQRLQRRWQPGLMRHRTLATAAGSADPPAKVIAPRPKLSDAVIDRATGEPSC